MPVPLLMTRAITTVKPDTTAQPTTTATGGLAVYGDSYSSGISEGGIGATGWPALVADQLGMQLQLSAATLAGYVRPGSTDQTYPQMAEAQLPRTPQ